MRIQNENDLLEIGIDWEKTVSIIEETVQCLADGDYSQPIKPYLRYRDPRNRIIAMPAFVGGNINMAGIKWIASFPGNIDRGIPRAHSVVILNEADTGRPLGTIDTPLLSVIRTTSVSGLVFKYFNELRKPQSIKIGMTGFGPIGQYHAKMCFSMFGGIIEKMSIYDLREIDQSLFEDSRMEVADSWEQAYEGADVFITCTVSDAPYIDKKPKVGSLHLNVSLRDYTIEVYDWFKEAMYVDDWEEVNRENTDIEMMHLHKGLEEEDTFSIVDMVVGKAFARHAPETPILFNPMGMAVFDIAIGSYYYQTEPVHVVNL
ncbi:MAG: 2,3-diaminopropionate biosynthesis protein SbnB [Roseivirga sp.]|nr:2,3-diaminopropionate biosynthesis protein SbnB [Roseivirga sp.]